MSIRACAKCFLAARRDPCSRTRRSPCSSPTDGSPLAACAVAHGVNLAKSLNSKVLILTVTERLQVFALKVDQLEEVSNSFREYMQKRVECILSEASEIARNLGVEATTLQMEDDAPYRAIIRMAEDQVCNLIVMGSHGRGGLSALLGSETVKVLAHSNIPVLVVR